MKKNRCPYLVKDNNLKSPNPKDSKPTEAKPSQANPCVRRNLARDIENPSEDQSSGEDSVVILSKEEPCGEENTHYYDEAERLPINNDKCEISKSFSSHNAALLMRNIPGVNLRPVYGERLGSKLLSVTKHLKHQDGRWRRGWHIRVKAEARPASRFTRLRMLSIIAKATSRQFLEKIPLRKYLENKSSFAIARGELLVAYDWETIDNEEFILLLKKTVSRNTTKNLTLKRWILYSVKLNFESRKMLFVLRHCILNWISEN